MRLAIVNLTGGNFSGGYRKYLRNMLPRLAAHKDVEALLCVSPEAAYATAWFKKLPGVDYCTCKPVGFSYLANIPDKDMAESLNKFSPDIIFLPIERHMKFKNVPIVNMVRNMEPFIPNIAGDPAPVLFKKFIQRKLASNSVRKADHTIAVSDFVKDHLMTKLNIPGSKVSRVYHGHTLPLTENGIRPTAVPVGWDSGFLFTCGSIRPARGLEDVLGALKELKAQNLAPRLVVAGEAEPGMEKYLDKLQRFLALHGLSDSVCWAGKINEDEMRWCYNKCRLFIMTTRVEACPNTAIEAMSYGTITIAADNPPLPEFFSKCAAYYAAGDSHLLAAAITSQLALSPKDYVVISEQARKRSLLFSWDLTVENTITVLKQVWQRSKTRTVSQKSPAPSA